jgi:elongation factor Ts
MSNVSASLIKQLRDMTSAGMLDCKEALLESGGDLEQAVEILRKKGLKGISKRASKTAAEGVVGTYSHVGDQVVAIVELNCETDFVARGDEFKSLARGLAMHVAAMKPLYVSEQSVPAEVLEKEREIAREQVLESKGKAPSEIIEKIVNGKLEKFFEEVVLLNQAYIVNEDANKTIKQLLEEYGAKVGEKVEVRRFVRFEVGEGIVKESGNFVADIAAMIA